MLVGGVTPILMLLLFTTAPLQVAGDGIRPPRMILAFGKRRTGEFIRIDEILDIRFHEDTMGIRVVIQPRLASRFYCQNDEALLERLAALRSQSD